MPLATSLILLLLPIGQPCKILLSHFMPQTVSFSLLLFLPAGCFGRFGLLTVSPPPCKIRQHFSNPLARRVFFSLMENAPCRFSCRFSHPRLLSIWFSFQYPPAFCPPVFAFSSRCPSSNLVKFSYLISRRKPLFSPAWENALRLFLPRKTAYTAAERILIKPHWPT